MVLHRKQSRIIDDHFADVANKYVFKVALPVMLFKDLSSSDFYSKFDIKFVLYCVIVTLLMFSGATLDSTGTKAANENEWGNGADTFATAENKGFVDASICGITLSHGATKILATDIVRDSTGNVTSASPVLVVRGGTGGCRSGPGYRRGRAADC